MATATQLSDTQWRLTRDTPDPLGRVDFIFNVPSGSSQDVSTLEALYQGVHFPDPPGPPTIEDGTVIFFDRFQRPFTKQDLAKTIQEGAALVATPPAYTDHFCFGSTETGEAGELGWSFTNGSVFYASPVADRPGILTRRSGATAGQAASFYPGSAPATTTLLKSDLQELNWSFFPVSGGGVATYRVGIASDAAGAPPSDGFYLESLPTDTNWFAVRRRAGVETRTDTGMAVSAAWVDYRLRRVSTDNWEVYINGGAFQIIHTIGNIPLEATAMLPFTQIIPNSTTARDLHMDFFSLVTR